MDLETKEMLRKIAGLSALGIAIPLAIAMGLAIGVTLDRWLDTTPILTLVFLALGIAAAFLTLYREVRRLD